MTFCPDWREPELARACLDRELRQIVEYHSRVTRQRASRALLLLVPLLIALLGGSYGFLSRRHVGGWSVLGVAVLGGLLGGTLVVLRRLVPLTRTRTTRMSDPDPVAVPLLLALLVVCAAVGTCSALLVHIVRDARAYRPQTVYLIAVVTSVVWSRFATVPAPSLRPR